MTLRIIEKLSNASKKGGDESPRPQSDPTLQPGHHETTLIQLDTYTSLHEMIASQTSCTHLELLLLE